MKGVFLDIVLRSFIRAERRTMSFNEFRMALHAFPSVNVQHYFCYENFVSSQMVQKLFKKLMLRHYYI